MCGIAGWVDFARDPNPETVREMTVREMTRRLTPRGPDETGLWADAHVALGHRRLSVIDLAAGQQPMVAEDRDGPAAVITFGGEIYNFTEIRAELVARGHRFRTRSDTEVLLRA